MFFYRKFLLFFGGAILFLCLLLNFIQISFPINLQDSSLVYCPLQKIWVKGNESNNFTAENSLDYICASEKKKNFLSFEISLKTFQPVNEKTFFEYLAKGKQAFTKFGEFPRLPKHEFFNASKSEAVTNNFKQKIEKNILSRFSFAQHQRPPNISVSTDFDFQFSRELEKISRNINPRSPPFFI